jgi:hypothetical protein
MKRKLKLTKLTVSNLDSVKGGVDFPECGCPYTDPQQGAYVYNINHTITCTAAKTQCS